MERSLVGTFICLTAVLHLVDAMSSSRKINYLSKYLDNTPKNDDSDYLDRKHSKKKSKKRKRRVRDDTATTSLLAVHDDEDDARALPDLPVKQDKGGVAGGSDGEDSDDGPVVVESSYCIRPTDEVRRAKRDSASSSSSTPHRRRHDSEDTNSDMDVDSKRHSRRRQRHDSDDEDSEPRRRRHDSLSDEDSGGSSEPTTGRKRHDSSDDNDSNESSDDKNGQPQKMSSGHTAGLQTGSDFKVRELRIQSKKRAAASKMVEEHGMGETVYRDATSGRTVAKPSIQQRTGQRRELTPHEQRALNTGRVQLEKLEQASKDMAVLHESAFARRQDDTALEDERKAVLRPDDPMLKYATKRRSAAAHAERVRKPQRPVYKGPPAKPNRFGIGPGHRWDANDRSNGFEDKVLAKKFSAVHNKERAYRYSAADL